MPTSNWSAYYLQDVYKRQVMNIQPQPVYATHEHVRFEVRDSLDFYILEDSLELEMLPIRWTVC